MTLAELLKRSAFLLCLGVSLQVVGAQAKPDGPDVYGARNTFGAMTEYSNDSSHIILGNTEHVKLGSIGLQYQRRLFANRYAVLSYALEFRPVILESLETSSSTYAQTSPTPATYPVGSGLASNCVAGSSPYTYTFNEPGLPPVTYVGTITVKCGRQVNYAQGFSPFGIRVNLRPHRRLQPTFSTFAGYIFSTRPLPEAEAGSFNFSFELGVGFEYYLARHRSVRLEYQVQHYSNGYTANSNPGVDSGMFKLSYSFGR